MKGTAKYTLISLTILVSLYGNYRFAQVSSSDSREGLDPTTIVCIGTKIRSYGRCPRWHSGDVVRWSDISLGWPVVHNVEFQYSVCHLWLGPWHLEWRWVDKCRCDIPGVLRPYEHVFFSLSFIGLVVISSTFSLHIINIPKHFNL